ncbi:hypothetical protein EON83_23350 [bacterium]|nr:MAG: hypothetical protein EON83_23350 [bacterium]
MTSSKTRWLFWIVFISCYALVTIIAIKTVKRDGSWEADFVRSMAHPLAIGISALVTVGLFRIAGITLRSKVESPLEVEVRQNTPTHSEMRTYPTLTMLRVISGFCVVLAVLMVAGELYLRSRFTIHTSMPLLPSFLGLLAISGLFWLASYLGRRGNFVARADEYGVEIQNLGERNKRVALKWDEVASVVCIEHFTMMGNQTQLEFRDASGEAKGQVSLDVAPRAQQREFSQVVARYSSPSVVA